MFFCSISGNKKQNLDIVLIPTAKRTDIIVVGQAGRL